MPKILAPQAVIDYLDSVGFWEPFQKGGIELLETAENFAKTRMRVGTVGRRLGGTISGPAQFTAADATTFLAIVATLGPQAGAVTANTSINFLARPHGEALLTEARLLKIGRNLAVADCKITCEGSDGVVATATSSFSLTRHREKDRSPQHGTD